MTLPAKRDSQSFIPKKTLSRERSDKLGHNVIWCICLGCDSISECVCLGPTCPWAPNRFSTTGYLSELSFSPLPLKRSLDLAMKSLSLSRFGFGISARRRYLGLIFHEHDFDFAQQKSDKQRQIIEKCEFWATLALFQVGFGISERRRYLGLIFQILISRKNKACFFFPD